MAKFTKMFEPFFWTLRYDGFVFHVDMSIADFGQKSENICPGMLMNRNATSAYMI